MSRIGGTTVVVAAAVFLASAVAFGASVVNAFRVGEVPASSTHGPGEVVNPGAEVDPAVTPDGGGERETPGESVLPPQDAPPERSLRLAASPESVRGGSHYPQVSSRELLQAVNGDLFQPDRTPPLERYLLPSQREAPAPGSRNNRGGREPDLRIVGTAIAGDLALAMVQPDDSIPFVVLLGESVDGFLLAAIDEENVTLTRDGEEFVYPVTEPRRGRSSSSRDRNARNRAATEEAAQAMAERVQQMLRQLQQRGGGDPQARPGRLRLAPNLVRLQRGGQALSTGRATIQPPGGGGSGGGGTLP